MNKSILLLASALLCAISPAYGAVIPDLADQKWEVNFAGFAGLEQDAASGDLLLRSFLQITSTYRNNTTPGGPPFEFSNGPEGGGPAANASGEFKAILLSSGLKIGSYFDVDTLSFITVNTIADLAALGTGDIVFFVDASPGTPGSATLYEDLASNNVSGSVLNTTQTAGGILNTNWTNDGLGFTGTAGGGFTIDPLVDNVAANFLYEDLSGLDVRAEVIPPSSGDYLLVYAPTGTRLVQTIGGDTLAFLSIDRTDPGLEGLKIVEDGMFKSGVAVGTPGTFAASFPVPPPSSTTTITADFVSEIITTLVAPGPNTSQPFITFSDPVEFASQPVPEPATIATWLGITALGTFGAFRRRLLAR